MASAPSPPAPRESRVLPIALGLGMLAVVVVIVVLLAIWLWTHTRPGVQRERVVQQITVVQPPPPPPPPPEPEEKIMEEQEIVQPDKPDVPKDVPTPADKPADAPATPSAEAAGLDKPADAGSDSFHLASGGGGGLFGRGGGGGGGMGWGRYVELHIQRALQRDQRTRAATGSVRVTVNIDASGRFIGAALKSTTGDARLDTAIRDVLSTLPPLGHSRPADQEGLTNATITMKRTDG